jgi:hypothetical protein
VTGVGGLSRNILFRMSLEVEECRQAQDQVVFRPSLVEAGSFHLSETTVYEQKVLLWRGLPCIHRGKCACVL